MKSSLGKMVILKAVMMDLAVELDCVGSTTFRNRVVPQLAREIHPINHFHNAQSLKLIPH
jgi:hypothetical protein